MWGLSLSYSPSLAYIFSLFQLCLVWDGTCSVLIVALRWVCKVVEWVVWHGMGNFTIQASRSEVNYEDGLGVGVGVGVGMESIDWIWWDLDPDLVWIWVWIWVLGMCRRANWFEEWGEGGKVGEV